LNCSRDGEAFMALGPMMNLLPLKPWINHHHHQYHVNGWLLCHKVQGLRNLHAKKRVVMPSRRALQFTNYKPRLF